MGNLTVFCSLCFLLQVFFQGLNADVYFHVPRGSNNRLKGEGANRQNANRAFNSQNNAKGGYNVGEKDEKKTDNWYHMQYFMSGSKAGKTILSLEWTNQHGCGDGDLNCNIVLQYLCQPTNVKDPTRRIRNGNSESTPLYKLHRRMFRKFSYERIQSIRKQQAVPARVLHEQWEWFDKCNLRQRNRGLFTADQKLKCTSTRCTRQNPNGKRYGYECSEERDYYPYFHPTDWIDIAVLANKREDCSYYRTESFNTKPKSECMILQKGDKKWHPKDNPWRHKTSCNNKADCEKYKGKWVEFSNYLETINRTKEECKTGPNGERLIWAVPYRTENIALMPGADPEDWKRCLVALDPPDCRPAPYSRSNHLGNAQGVVPLSYDWVLPHFPSGQEQRCVLRIRYNISTNDYDPGTTYSDKNGEKSPIKNDPQVLVGEDGNNKVPLQLAINTAQFGRTFQDRSHIFKIIPREEHFKDKTIYNLNVRGKRGNIVQVYPAVEYDFAPKRLNIGSNDLVHIQWDGSNRNPKGNDGEGRAQTDRSNIVDMVSPDKSSPLLGSQSTMFDNAQVVHSLHKEGTKTGADLAIAMATAGYYLSANALPSSFESSGCNDADLSKLDCYPPSFSGFLLKFNKGTYYYMCTRNNNFTNRSQKGRLTVS